jgi:cytidyltransferase-like protein
MENKDQKTVRIMLDLCATMIHHGHIRLIKKAKMHFKAKNTCIIIGLTTDEEIKKNKGYFPELNFNNRKEIIEALIDVDQVVAVPWNITNAVLDEFNIDHLVHGSDNQNEADNVIVFSKTEHISSDELRKRAINSIVQRRNSNKIMFTPGPSNMSYLNMIDLKGVFGRGDDEYTHIETIVLDNILKLTSHDKIVRFQGGGTTAIDVATSNIVLGKVLIIDSGYYSRRLERIFRSKLDTLPNTSFKIIKYQDITDELAIHDNYDWIATAYAETADAFLCDINLLKTLAEAKNAKLFLDATASINLEPNHYLADACTFSSCKGLGGLTGAAFITYKDAAYKVSLKGNVPFTLDIETHINKLYTGPYHAICSLYTISKNFNSITKNVKQSKSFFLKKYSNRIMRPKHEQPLVSTLIKAKKVIASEDAILYQPRASPKGLAVICHFGDMFSSQNDIGKIYDVLSLE